MSHRRHGLIIVKPAHHQRTQQDILHLLTTASLFPGITIACILPREWVDALYAEHVEKEWYENHAAYMTSGVSVVCLVNHDLEDDPIPTMLRVKRAVRGLYADPMVSYRNAIHTSDSLESAEREEELFWQLVDLHAHRRTT
ncbi:MAG: hypothetical protein KDB07_00355 [Planctomycetes bacterium]|nr:hypothetical protein [Planctomycetota bacterium]